jgi:serine/threonine protein phosphatase 1
MNFSVTYQPVVHLEQNTTGSDFVVGDIHGCVPYLWNALSLLNFDLNTDRVISVGDLIDRGPSSMEATKLLQHPWFYAVRGNHEQMMIDSVLHQLPEPRKMWHMNGGTWIHDHDLVELKQTAVVLNKLPYIITVGEGSSRYNVVHAELTKDHSFFGSSPLVTDQMIDSFDFTENEQLSMIWGRRMISHSEMLHRISMPHSILMSPTYVGHTPVVTPTKIFNQIYIDTGAVYQHTQGNASINKYLTVAEPSKQLLHMYNIAEDKITSISTDNWIPLGR